MFDSRCQSFRYVKLILTDTYEFYSLCKDHQKCDWIYKNRPFCILRNTILIFAMTVVLLCYIVATPDLPYK